MFRAGASAAQPWVWMRAALRRPVVVSRSGRWQAGRSLLGGLLAALLFFPPCRPVLAQVDAQGQSDLPGQNSVDPEIDPFPFDGRLAVRSYFKEHLPTYWWANEPEYNLGRFSVTIHVPDMWRGNPTAALLALCPQPYSNLWRGLKEIELKVMYRNAPWPGVTCRP